MPPRKLFPQDLYHHVHLPSQLQSTKVVAEGVLATDHAGNDLDVIHVIAVLPECRIQKLWGHGDCHSIFKGGLISR
jgi:hypothetical protein